MDTEEFLEHVGVKGMKWGVRKGSLPTIKKARTTSSDYKQTAPLRKKHPSQLTNKQLQSVNNRMNLEQNFSRLSKEQSKTAKIKTGHKYVKEIVGVIGTVTTLAGLYKTFSGKSSIDLGRKVMSSKELLKRLAPYARA